VVMMEAQRGERGFWGCVPGVVVAGERTDGGELGEGNLNGGWPQGEVREVAGAARRGKWQGTKGPRFPVNVRCFCCDVRDLQPARVRTSLSRGGCGFLVFRTAEGRALW
jgi:hypothetical protein